MSALAPTPAVGVAADVDEELSHRRFSLMAQQVSALRWSFVLIVAVLVAIAWRAVPQALLFGWVVLALATHVLRLRALRAHAPRRDESGARKLRLGVAWNAALGVVFGASASFMLWLDTTLAAVLTTIVVSAAAGAVAISGPMLPVYAAYTLSIMVPFAVVWAYIGGGLGLGLAALMVVFIAVQYRFARQVSQTFTESFLIRQENEALVAQLTAARDQADSASRAKTRFLAAASHDLRQPLHALSLHSAALTLDPHAKDTPAIAAAISASIEDVSALLDSLLDISKLDAGTLVAERRPIVLSRLVESVARSVRPVVEAKGLRFALDCEPERIVHTDPLLFERVLRNLLDNAIKFTAQGSIGVSLQQRGETVEVAVSDTGVGIAPELQHKVFEEFFQVDRQASGADATRGLGLGLAIVSRLAGLLGMTVALDSAPGRGSIVRLQLPGSALPVPQAAPAAVAHAGFGGWRVLVLDDEPAIRAGMSALLGRLDCEVLAAGSVAEALRLLREHRPQVVLADYRLGEADTGIDAIARLRAESPGLRALLISGDTAPDRLQEADRSGIALLHKPVSLVQLRDALTSLRA